MPKTIAPLAWLEPFARPGLFLRTLGRAYAAGLLAFLPFAIVASTRHVLSVPVLLGAIALAAIAVPVTLIALDHRTVRIDESGVRVRGGRGLFVPRTIPFATIGRADVVRERAAGGTQPHSLRLYGSGLAREILAVAVSATVKPGAVVSSLRAAGVRAALADAAPSARGRARVAVALLALVAGTVWSARVVRAALAAPSDAAGAGSGLAFPAVAIECITPDGRGAVAIRTFVTGTLLDVRIGRTTFSPASLDVRRQPAGDVLIVAHLAPAAATARFASVSISHPNGSVDSEGAPFDATAARPQGPRC